MPTAIGSDFLVSPESIAYYRENGFVHIPGIIDADEAARYRDAALDAATRLGQFYVSNVFDQFVNVWNQEEALRGLTFHPSVAAAAAQLAGAPLRLWHDQILIKHPGTSIATEYHQDQPYWPHAESVNSLSCWIALCDVPVERGCMTFIPGSQRQRDLPAQDLTSDKSLFALCPELTWYPRVTVPLRAGDGTFHSGRCAHMATPNLTDEPRVAFVTIFMDAGTIYTGERHVVTDPLDLKVGQPFEHELFPARP